jgi:ABC-type bacteriocin/lantibiotic exporter with double-glycine peptidase domain
MLSSTDIVKILQYTAFELKHTIETSALESLEKEFRVYARDEFQEFRRDLVEAGSKTKLLLIEQVMPLEAVDQLLAEGSLVLSFRNTPEQYVPVIFQRRKKKIALEFITPAGNKVAAEQAPWLINEKGEAVLFVIFPYKNIVSDDAVAEPGQELKPVKRFFRLLSTEKKEIMYVIFYAIIVGLISLVLPVGIQTTIELISGGVFFSSVYLLIGLVILGVLLAGIFQIVQISLVEHIQRRLFTKAAFEFAFRIPRLKIEGIARNYAPELVNRFFDIMTIQKGLPKFLIDLSSSAVQILFGLLLLSLYHPFFVFFSLVLVITLVTIFYYTGPRGLESSLSESKYKYKVVYWFEELARTLTSFKLAGNTGLPFRKTDYNVNNYLKYRKAHFSVLITQFSFIVFFKAVVTGSLLIMGTILVVNREITLGQFVASEIVIILILNAVEKVIMYMDVVYDLLTAVDKVGYITDLPLDRMGGTDLPRSAGKGFSLRVSDLRYRYPGAGKYALKGVNLSIRAGERVCIAGSEASGKTTLTNILTGLQCDFEGAVTIDDFSIRDLDLTHLRNRIAKNISPEDIFDGTILENVTLGKEDRTVQDAVVALQKAGLSEKVNMFPEGLNTHVISGGKGFSSMMVHRLILARCMAKRPELIVLNDFFTGLIKSDKLDLVQRIVDRENNWTVIAVSNDPLIMAACDHVVVMDKGRIIAEGNFEELVKKGEINKFFE